MFVYNTHLKTYVTLLYKLLLHQAYISSVLHPYDSWERVPCHNIPHDPDFCGATLPCDLGGAGLDPAENYKYPVWYRET